MKKMKRFLVLVMAIVIAMTATPVSAEAAVKKVTVKVNSPKKDVKLSGTKITIHTKKAVKLSVKAKVSSTKKVQELVTYTGAYKDGKIVWTPVYKNVKKTVTSTKDVTAKAKYKSNNPKVVSVNKRGQMTVKRAGNATLTVKYKNQTKRFKIVVAEHNWKAHKKTKDIVEYHDICQCGVDLDELCKNYPKEKCSGKCGVSLGAKYCDEPLFAHQKAHRDKGEMDNYSQEYVVVGKATWIDYYSCSCGARKAGEKEPK